jgi:hypothetical protein
MPSIPSSGGCLAESEVVHLCEVRAKLRAERLQRKVARYDHMFKPAVVAAVYELLDAEIERQSAT